MPELSIDSGATVNVLPYDTGLQLGGLWDDRKATIKLAGNLGGFLAQPIFVMATIGDLSPIRLVFAWSHSNNVSLILGQMNLFRTKNCRIWIAIDGCLICSFSMFSTRIKLLRYRSDSPAHRQPQLKQVFKHFKPQRCESINQAIKLLDFKRWTKIISARFG